MFEAKAIHPGMSLAALPPSVEVRRGFASRHAAMYLWLPDGTKLWHEASVYGEADNQVGFAICSCPWSRNRCRPRSLSTLLLRPQVGW